jgi:hypothetical protein
MEVHALGSKPGMTGPEMARHARRVYERASREVQGLQGGGLPGGPKDGGKRKAGGSASSSSTGGGAEKKQRSKKDGANEREMDPNAPTRQTLKATTEVRACYFKSFQNGAWAIRFLGAFSIFFFCQERNPSFSPPSPPSLSLIKGDDKSSIAILFLLLISFHPSSILTVSMLFTCLSKNAMGPLRLSLSSGGRDPQGL